jgi:hypothetical protein
MGMIFDTLIKDICKYSSSGDLMICGDVNARTASATMSKFLIQFKNETSLSLSKSFETKSLTFHTAIERLGLFVVFVRLVGAMVF